MARGCRRERGLAARDQPAPRRDRRHPRRDRGFRRGERRRPRAGGGRHRDPLDGRREGPRRDRRHACHDRGAELHGRLPRRRRLVQPHADRLHDDRRLAHDRRRDRHAGGLRHGLARVRRPRLRRDRRGRGHDLERRHRHAHDASRVPLRDRLAPADRRPAVRDLRARGRSVLHRLDDAAPRGCRDPQGPRRDERIAPSGCPRSGARDPPGRHRRRHAHRHGRRPRDPGSHAVPPRPHHHPPPRPPHDRGRPRRRRLLPPGRHDGRPSHRTRSNR